MFAHFFISRPVFATAISVLVVLAGGLALTQLPIAQYPEVVPPQVIVTATYPGADARTVSETVASPIEDQVNGVEGMLYMESQCTNDGTMQLTITFKLGTNPDFAQVLVQNRVAIATRRSSSSSSPSAGSPTSRSRTSWPGSTGSATCSSSAAGTTPCGSGSTPRR